jgi:glutamate synthase domain-containing protein 2
MHEWLHRIDEHFPVRYTAWLLSGLLCVSLAVWWLAYGFGGVLVAAALALVALGWRDARQTRHSVLRNYPLIGHLRFLLEYIRPEIRQYFIESDSERTPFSRQQRSVVYQRAKGDPDKRPFGTHLDMQASGYEWINHSLAPTEIPSADFRITIGASPSCSQPYSASVLNVSALSFGALSANAILALNGGAKKGGFAHDTGEGSISEYHRANGGDLIWEIGSGYFGCRDAQGRFDEERFARNATPAQVKMIEIKLSQGAKPGHGGVLPGRKVTAEIAAARGVEPGEDCVSPARHSAFATPFELLEFVERLRRLSGGKPTGFKLCIGHPWEWFAICKAMLETDITPDFIVIDGAEGGTGAAPIEFTDHVGTPLQEGLWLAHNSLLGLNLRERIQLGCSGKIISAFDMARSMALGANWCNSARGFMFALGCLQAQGCHTGACPTGVATQDPLRQRALVVPEKIERVYRFHLHTLLALRELTQAAGLLHPNEFRATHLVRRVSQNDVRLLANLLPGVRAGKLLDAIGGHADWPHNVYRMYWPLADPRSFAARDLSDDPRGPMAADLMDLLVSGGGK